MIPDARTDREYEAYAKEQRAALAPDRPIVAEQQGGDDWEATLRYCEKQWSEERGVMIDRIQAIKKVRSDYLDQARFAEAEPASYFYEFARRIDAALSVGMK